MIKFYGTNDGRVYYKHDDNINVVLTDEEIKKLNQGMQAELEDGELKRTAPEVDTFVEIKIPLQVFQASEDLQKKTGQAKLFFSKLETTIDDEGNYVLSNINIKHIPHIIKTKEEYDQLVAVGVEFSEEIDDLFTEDNEDE